MIILKQHNPDLNNIFFVGNIGDTLPNKLISFVIFPRMAVDDVSTHMIFLVIAPTISPTMNFLTATT